MTLVLGGPAVAGDLPAATPIYKAKAPVATPFSWEGFYFGMQGAGGWGHSQQTGTQGNVTNNFGFAGGAVGGEYGTNWQFGHLVVGTESDSSWVFLKGTAPEIINPGYTATTEQSYLAMSRGRVGYAQDRWLVYATGGLADGYVEAISSGPAGSVSENEFRWGWNAGAGVEWAFTPQWSAKIEYIHLDLGHASYLNPVSPPFVDRAFGVALTDDLIRVGVNYHYDLPNLVLQTINGITGYH
jgi:outer membrane immunogenic protein